MEGAAQLARRLRFADFEIDLRARELRKSGARLKIQEQSFQVLETLLERPGEVVTRDELRNRLWPADTFVDFEDGLNTAVKKLRGVLGDSPASPRFVETIPRRGYRFVHAVDAVDQHASNTSRWGYRNAGMWLAAAGIALLAMWAMWSRNTEVPVTAREEIKSIAVLPLRNVTGDAQSQQLCNAITDALITELGRLGGPRVVSFQSVRQYMHTDLTLPKIAEELEVQAIVEGSVVREGGHIAVHVQMVRATPEEHLWAENFKREISGILSLHAEVSRAIAATLQISPAMPHASAARRPVQREAFEAFAGGRDYFHRGTDEGSLKARELFQRAIEKDPGYAEAYASLAELYVRGGPVLVGDPLEGRVNARKWAKKALELNDALVEPHTALAWAEMADWDWASAEQEFRRAVELNPSYALAQVWYAEYLAALQRFDEARDRAALALQLDPASLYVNSRAGWVYFFSEQDDKALACWRRALQTEPNLVHARIGIAHLLITQGKYFEVLGELGPDIDQKNGDPFIVGTLAYAYAKVGRRDNALEFVQELERRRDREHVPSLALVYPYLGLGDMNRTFFWLQVGYQEHAWMYHLNVNRLFTSLRTDPRFSDLVRRVGLPGSVNPRTLRR